MKKHLSGFVQVLILPFLILGAITVTAGSYYAVKHIPQSVNKGKIIVDEGNITEVINNEPIVRGDNGMPSILSGRPNILKEKSTSSQKSTSNQQKISINNKVGNPKQTEVGTNFDSLISQAEEQIKLLEQDKEDFQLLRKTIDEHRQKSMEHATNMTNLWISLLDTSISSVRVEAQSILRHRRDYLTSDREYINKSIDSFYSILDTYFIDSLQSKGIVEVIISQQKDLNDCIKIWNNKEKDFMCIFYMGFIPTNRKHNPNDINKIILKLAETDGIVLDLIDKHTAMAKDGVSSDLNSIQDSANILAGVQVRLNQISQEATQVSSQQLLSQPKITANVSTCSNPVSKRILVPGKGFISVKQCSNGTYIEESKYVPDTSSMTPQQICDMRKSAWLGAGARVGGSPDCSDLGL